MTTATKTRCEVLDQIVEWTKPDGTLNIQVGDLVVEKGQFELVADARVSSNGFRVEYALKDRVGLRSAAPSDVVAVRRYVESTEE